MKNEQNLNYIIKTKQQQKIIIKKKGQDKRELSI